jgi:ABC-type multidrug transport system ATPase subunit
LHDVVRHHKAEGKTTILVSHSLSDVEQLCDRVAVLRGGRLAFSGALGELIAGATADDSATALQDALEPMYAGAST